MRPGSGVPSSAAVMRKWFYSSSGESGSPWARLTTLRGEFVLEGQKAADMAALVEEHLKELRGRSVYALALRDSHPNGTSPPRWARWR